MATNPSNGHRRQLKVIAADDSFLIREALQRMLAGSQALKLAAMCSDGDELLAAVEKHHPDVVLTDMRMPPSGDREGLRVASELRASYPDVGVVILTQHDEPRYGRALIQDGAAGRA